jgi:hypothetical protein
MIPEGDCSVLVSCCNQRGGLYQITIKNQDYTIKKLLDIECRGIAKYNNKYIIASNVKGLFILDENFQIIQHRDLDKELDIHGMAVYSDKVFLVETKTNSIGIYDLNNQLRRIDEIRFSSENYDTCHVNDIYIHKDKLFVSMFHHPSSFLNKNKISKSNNGAILVYSLIKRKVERIEFKSLNQPHSIKYIGCNYYYCISAEFTVVRNKEVVFKGSGYTRGLAIKGDTMVIGQSKSRRTDELLRLHPNIVLECGIYVHNLKTRISTFIPIPSDEVYSVLLLEQ